MQETPQTTKDTPWYGHCCCWLLRLACGALLGVATCKALALLPSPLIELQRLGFVDTLPVSPVVVHLGTAALEHPEWTREAISEHGDRIAVGLDVRGTTLAARGWTREGGDLWETLARLDADGCARYVVTDVTKDGTLKGPNLHLLREVCQRPDRPVIASGGVAVLEDLHRLTELTGIGVEGAIVGKALYAGTFTLPEALAAVAPRRDLM